MVQTPKAQTFEQQVEEFYYSVIGSPYTPGIEDSVMNMLIFWQRCYDSGTITHQQFELAKPYGFKLIKAIRNVAHRGYAGQIEEAVWIDAPNYDAKFKYRT